MCCCKRYPRPTWRLVWIGAGLEPAWKMIANTPTRKFLQEQTRDVPTTIPTHVNQERRVVKLREIAAMELGISIASHIGNMNIANTTLRSFMYRTSIVFYPFTITCRRFIT